MINYPLIIHQKNQMMNV